MRGALLALVVVGCGSASPPASPPVAPPLTRAAAGVRVVPVAQRDPATLERDCAKADLAACWELAERHANGRGIDLDHARAAELRARGCEQKHARSCASLAAQYAYAHGVAADEPKAREFFTRGCDLGDAWSCEGLALLEKAPERDRLFAHAFALYLRACDDGDARGCFGASALFGNLRVTTDVPAASWEASRARETARCMRGTDDEALESCWASWRMQDGGHGGPANLGEAARSARRGCDRKQPTMCSILAHMHEQGRGVLKDDARAQALYLRACKLGDPYACYFAANREPDPKRQLALRRRACDAGNLGECATVIEALDNADPQAARALRERSCRRGWSEACVEVGDALVTARRVADAMPWFARACRDDTSSTTGCTRAATLRREACDKGDAAACQELAAELAKLPVARRVAVMHACCATRPELKALPGGALLLFFDALAAKDLAAVKTFVHGKHGLRVRLGWHDDTGASEERFHFRATARALGKLVEVSRPSADALHCDEVAAGIVRCHAFGGGYGASFELVAEGGRLYVTGIDEESH